VYFAIINSKWNIIGKYIRKVLHNLEIKVNDSLYSTFIVFGLLIRLLKMKKPQGFTQHPKQTIPKDVIGHSYYLS
jgi:hypothetical protein